MFQRAKYVEPRKLLWQDIPNPAATIKYDGGHYYLSVQSDGSLKYYSRRESVKGGFPERSAQIPHLSNVKLPQYAGHVYSVELIHTGKDKNNKESHPAVSGILNSLLPRSIETQLNTGPVRAVLLDVINPPLPTYKEKIAHLKEVEKAFGKPALMFVPEIATTKPEIIKLIERTKAEGREGIIVTSLTKPESINPRIKIKHFDTYNLRVVRIIQEEDTHGNLKPSMGAMDCVDSSGRVVCTVGTGFSKELREEIWRNQFKWIGKLIQVKTMGLGSVGGKLRAPVFNGGKRRYS